MERAAIVVLDGRLAAVVVLRPEGREVLSRLGRFRFGRYLRGQLADGLEPVCLPRRWRFVAALPVGEMGKRRAEDLAALFAPLDRMPQILERRETGEGRVELDLEIGAGLIWFQGHFPGRPILPGVVQLDWAVQLAPEALSLPPITAREFQVKYKAVISPGDRVTLALRHDAAKNRLSFEYKRGEDICSSGTVFP